MIAQLLRTRQLWRAGQTESGQSLVEYSLIIALIALAGMSGVVALHGGVGQLYGSVQAVADAMARAIS